MAFGDFRHDKDLRDAWHGFCENLKRAGDLVFKDHTPPTSLQRADGFRFLTQALSQAFDLALESKDTGFPMVHSFCGPQRKLGGDNADFVYLQAWIDGKSMKGDDNFQLLRFPAELSRVRNILAAVTPDRESALAHAEAAERLAGEDELLVMAALNSQALILADMGDLDRAGSALEDAIQIARRTGHRHREAALLSHLGDIHHRAGRESEAREFQTRAVSIFSDIDAGDFEPELWLLTRW